MINRPMMACTCWWWKTDEKKEAKRRNEKWWSEGSKRIREKFSHHLWMLKCKLKQRQHVTHAWTWQNSHETRAQVDEKKGKVLHWRAQKQKERSHNHIIIFMFCLSFVFLCVLLWKELKSFIIPLKTSINRPTSILSEKATTTLRKANHFRRQKEMLKPKRNPKPVSSSQLFIFILLSWSKMLYSRLF